MMRSNQTYPVNHPAMAYIAETASAVGNCRGKFGRRLALGIRFDIKL
jgi:hypothetical protein